MVAAWVVPSPKSRSVVIGFTPGVQLPVTVTLSGAVPVVGDAFSVHDGGVLVAARISPKTVTPFAGPKLTVNCDSTAPLTMS